MVRRRGGLKCEAVLGQGEASGTEVGDRKSPIKGLSASNDLLRRTEGDLYVVYILPTILYTGCVIVCMSIHTQSFPLNFLLLTSTDRQIYTHTLRSPLPPHLSILLKSLAVQRALGTSSIAVMWELVRNAEPWAQLHTCCIRICTSARAPGSSLAHESLGTCPREMLLPPRSFTELHVPLGE